MDACSLFGMCFLLIQTKPDQIKDFDQIKKGPWSLGNEVQNDKSNALRGKKSSLVSFVVEVRIWQVAAWLVCLGKLILTARVRSQNTSHRHHLS